MFGVKFGLSCHRSVILEFGLSCERFGQKIGLSCEKRAAKSTHIERNRTTFHFFLLTVRDTCFSYIPWSIEKDLT
jgi:hypothetical protein